MKVAIHNPYLDTLGGGERYTLSFAKVLSESGFAVDIEWKDPKIREKLEKRFGLNLGDINFVADIKRGDGYEICFWVSDGSIPILRARSNFLHFQVPFHDVGGKSLLNKMKLFRIEKIICNSSFTKGFIDQEYGVSSVVIYPPVTVSQIKPKKKENLILSVGRFSQLQQSKRQDILIEAFKKLWEKGFEDWRLMLAGGIEVGVGNFIEKLEKLKGSYPIEIVKSPSFAQIRDLYGMAKIFWSATGFSEDEERHPEKVEHFGISLVEAMAGGAVPLVYRAGGHKEIVKEGVNGMFWQKSSTLVDKTQELIINRKYLASLSLQARKDANLYSEEKFEKKVLSCIL